MLLFLDVDGPLIPFGGPDPYPLYGPPAPHPLLSRLDPALGPRLLALGCDLVWATTWGEDANTVVGPWLGLPPLPLLDPRDDPPVPGVHWKTRPVLSRAAGRPFVWLDDEITPADREYVDAGHPAPALLHRVDPQRGLTREDFETVRTWLSRRPLT
ncbi:MULTISPECIES: HAD domain-containing protein [Streptomyces]|uniref:HAD domain-containing protein n=1 Tax=Streptomyces galilaeus TaxID=33899 RepID=A0ABW9IU08_STRGJ